MTRFDTSPQPDRSRRGSPVGLATPHNVFRLHRPSAAAIAEFLDAQQPASLTYTPTGLSRLAAPAGYRVGSDTTTIGRGGETYEAAREALFAWAAFRLEWVELYPRDAAVETGAVVAVLATHL